MTPNQQLAADVLLGRITGDVEAVRAGIELDDLRTATLGTLLALAAQHGLRIPRQIESWRHDTVGPVIDMNCERDSDVDAWAAVLGIGPARVHDPDGKPWYEASTMREPVWLAWNSVTVRCYRFHRVDPAPAPDRLPIPCGRCGHDEAVHFGSGPARRGCAGCTTGNCEPVLVRAAVESLPVGVDGWAIEGRTAQ